MTAASHTLKLPPVRPYQFLRWLAPVWLCVYVPAYAATYGWWHFLFLCNLGVLLTAIGLMLPNQLLLSSQALAAPPIALLWMLDVGSKFFFGEFLHGGTAYMWDTSLPVLVRTLSLYHIALPVLLLYCLQRHGYDQRAFVLQSSLAAAAFTIGVLIAPSIDNLNYVVHWPGTAGQPRQLWNVALSIAVLTIAVYWPMHRLCLLAFRPAAPERHVLVSTGRIR